MAIVQDQVVDGNQQQCSNLHRYYLDTMICLMLKHGYVPFVSAMILLTLGRILGLAIQQNGLDVIVTDGTIRYVQV